MTSANLLCNRITSNGVSCSLKEKAKRAHTYLHIVTEKRSRYANLRSVVYESIKLSYCKITTICCYYISKTC